MKSIDRRFFMKLFGLAGSAGFTQSLTGAAYPSDKKTQWMGQECWELPPINIPSLAPEHIARAFKPIKDRGYYADQGWFNSWDLRRFETERPYEFDIETHWQFHCGGIRGYMFGCSLIQTFAVPRGVFYLLSGGYRNDEQEEVTPLLQKVNVKNIYAPIPSRWHW
jgi:hypothetical protein